MSDLIRRKDALEAIVDERTHTILQAWINVKNTVPSVDAIEVVRCKECKHGTYCKEAEMYICNANDQDLYEADHFCSYGEREGE